MAAPWLLDLFRGQREEVVSLFRQYTEKHEMLQQLKQEGKREVLACARVIGATTSGATKFKDLIESAGAEVVLVEEAGEVLEAHVVTSLSSSVQHLIMIGDHKQLRPKVQVHSLTIMGARGFQLDKSMFERLVLDCGMNPPMLNSQRRMRPEISKLIRPTYPGLQDHPSVLKHPKLRGIPGGHNVLFLDHDKPEKGAGSHLSVSKTNTHEATLIVEIARLLLLNGYKTEQLVLLTPYLGQLLDIQRKIQSEIQDVQALVGEIDRAEMVQQGLVDEEDEAEEAGEAEDVDGAESKRGTKGEKVEGEQKKLRAATVGMLYVVPPEL
jgi:superfamily I DNA and/or RNA helicase